MIRIQVKLKPGHSQQELYEKAAGLLRVPQKELKQVIIRKKSLDARKKPILFYVYTLDIEASDEEKLVKCSRGAAVPVHPTSYRFPEVRGEKLIEHPVVVGTGPAGLFCGLFLARAGFAPILLERGKSVEERKKDIENYWSGGHLCPESNVQFGEGGAGTFSDGKLNTLVKDKYGRNTEVLKLLVEFGAPSEILYESKPHIGTDILQTVVTNLRREIIKLGGQVWFESKMTELVIKSGSISGVMINGERLLPTEAVILAIGHSARDTFSMLYEKNVPMEAKPFAVGFRVEHRQNAINTGQYGENYPKILPAASYKVAAKTSDGRGVYSFCMCPGGYVVNASSEDGRLCVNGMSYSGRKGENANSAIIVAVSPEDFESTHPLAGIAFQRGLEERAYQAGAGKVPVQTYGSFKESVEQGMPVTDAAGGTSFAPAVKGEYTFADITRILPMHLNKGIVEGMEQFAASIQGFNNPDTLLSGVEARTSSPVRIPRDESFQSVIKGLYPCGEGAGYAGGITSAAMDGIKVAEAVAAAYKPGS